MTGMDQYIQLVIYWQTFRLFPVFYLYKKCIEFLVYIYFHILPVYLYNIFPEVGILGQRVTVYIILLDTIKFPSIRLCHLPFSTAMCNSDVFTQPRQESIM